MPAPEINSLMRRIESLTHETVQPYFGEPNNIKTRANMQESLVHALQYLEFEGAIMDSKINVTEGRDGIQPEIDIDFRVGYDIHSYSMKVHPVVLEDQPNHFDDIISFIHTGAE